MKPSPFTEEQIIGVLREQETGATTGDVCRKRGICSATFYKWKAKYGGLELSDAKRPKALEDENARLKKLLAEAMLDTLRCRRSSGSAVRSPSWRPPRDLQKAVPGPCLSARRRNSSCYPPSRRIAAARLLTAQPPLEERYS